MPYLSTRFSFKIPLLLPRGFSANLVLILWYFLGGVIVWLVEENILAMNFEQDFEDPVDTVQDIIDRGLIPVVHWGAGWFVDLLARSDNPLYQQLANITVVPKDLNEMLFVYIQYGVQGNGTHVYLGNDVCCGMNFWGQYHISQEVIAGVPTYGGWIVNKLFHLNDQLAKHLLLYRQVCGIFLIIFFKY